MNLDSKPVDPDMQKFWMVFCKLGHRQAPATRYPSKLEAEAAAVDISKQNSGMIYYVLEAVERVGVPTAPIEVVKL